MEYNNSYKDSLGLTWMYNFKAGSWEHLSDVGAKSFVCWNCNREVASEKAYRSCRRPSYPSSIYICPNCKAPVVSDDGNNQILHPVPGAEISNLPEDVDKIYREIRKCMQSGCFNGAVMLMRKLIMHVAVEEGEDEGKSFAEYIDFLCSDGIIPKKSAGRADSVRVLGNSANHSIEDRTQDEAQNCFEFIELLLRVNYEFADEEEPEEVTDELIEEGAE